MDVTPPAAPGGDYVVTLPGIGTLSLTIDPNTNQVTKASVSASTGFTASAVKTDGDGDRVAVTLTSTTDPNQVYVLKVAVKPPAAPGGKLTVTANVKAGEHEDQDEQKGEHQDSEQGSPGDSHEHSGGGDD